MVTSAFILSLLNIIFGFIEILLGLRLVLRFFGANQVAPFVRWVYETSDPLIFPFRGMFPSPTLEGGYVLEINTLIALLMYALIGYLLIQLIEFVRYQTLHYHEEHQEK